MPNSQTGILLMHGGGHSSGARFAAVENFLHDNDIATHAFDFHGTTLSEREEEATSELMQFSADSQLPLTQIYLWGSSMSGHTACSLTLKFPTLAGVILQCPAAYGIDLQNIPFGENFHVRINEPLSWYTSPSFVHFSRFPGKKIVIYGSHDEVIPLDVQSKYAALADQTLILPGVGHKLLSPATPAELQGWDKMVETVVNFIKV